MDGCQIRVQSSHFASYYLSCWLSHFFRPRTPYLVQYRSLLSLEHTLRRASNPIRAGISGLPCTRIGLNGEPEYRPTYAWPRSTPSQPTPEQLAAQRAAAVDSEIAEYLALGVVPAEKMRGTNKVEHWMVSNPDPTTQNDTQAHCFC